MRDIRSSIYIICLIVLCLEHGVKYVGAAERQQTVRDTRWNYGYNHPPEESYQPIPVAIVYDGNDVPNEKTLQTEVSTESSPTINSDTNLDKLKGSDDDIFVKISRNNKQKRPKARQNGDDLNSPVNFSEQKPRPKAITINESENNENSATSPSGKFPGNYDVVIGRNHVESTTVKESTHSTSNKPLNEKPTIDTNTSPSQLKLTTHFNVDAETENGGGSSSTDVPETPTSENYPSTSKGSLKISQSKEYNKHSGRSSNVNSENYQIPVAIVYEDPAISKNNRGSLIINKNNRRRGPQRNQSKPVDATATSTSTTVDDSANTRKRIQTKVEANEKLNEATVQNENEAATGRNRKRVQRVRSRPVNGNPSTISDPLGNNNIVTRKSTPESSTTKISHTEVQLNKKVNEDTIVVNGSANQMVHNKPQRTSSGSIGGYTTYEPVGNKNSPTIKISPVLGTTKKVQAGEPAKENRIETIVLSDNEASNQGTRNDQQVNNIKAMLNKNLPSAKESTINPGSNNPRKYQGRNAETVTDDSKTDSAGGKHTRERDPVVPIIDSENRVYGDTGKFHYSYEGGDGTKAFGEGELKNVDEENAGESVVGGFSYTDKEGNDFSLSYTADERGYRPVGDHLPTPPPIPPAIARALAYLATKPTPEPVTDKPEEF